MLFAGVKKNDTAIKGVANNAIFSIQCALHVHGLYDGGFVTVKYAGKFIRKAS